MDHEALGTSFDEFLKENGIYDEVLQNAIIKLERVKNEPCKACNNYTFRTVSMVAASKDAGHTCKAVNRKIEDITTIPNFCPFLA